MSGASPSAAAMPVANVARMLFYNYDLDPDFDGKVTKVDASRSRVAKAVMALAEKREMSFDDVVSFLGKYDVSNRVGLPGRDGFLDNAEFRLMAIAVQQQVEHQDPALSKPVAELAAGLLTQVDTDRNQKITTADRSPLAAPLLRVAKATELDREGLVRLLKRYDQFDAANKRAGSDGKLGPMEIGQLEDDLAAAAPPRPAAAKKKQ